LHLAELGHVLDGDDDVDGDGLRGGRLHDAYGRDTAEEARDLVDRAHGRREPDALGGGVEQRVEPFEGQREVGAALGAGHRVHLVDDDGLDAAQLFAGPARH
jgi:hypothetical protein